MTTTAARTAFVSPFWDFLAIGGISLLHYLLFRYFMPTVTAMDAGLENLLGVSISGAWVAAYLVWAVNHPHFSATSARLYRSRSLMMQFPVTALGIPVLVTVFALLAMAYPTIVAPWFTKLFMYWSSYHFSAQTLGVSVLYARRNGLTLTPLARRALAIFIFSTYLAPTLRAESYAEPSNYYGIILPLLGLPPFLWDVFQWILALSAVASVLLIARCAKTTHQRVSVLIFVPAVTQFVWFIPGGAIEGFREFVPAYHSLQYLFIAWIMQLREKQVERNLAPSRRYVRLETLRWLAVNVAGGVFLFYLLPTGAQQLGFAAEPFQTWGIVIAAVQIHHFFVDGVIWKLKNPAVGQPLMTDLDELQGAPR